VEANPDLYRRLTSDDDFPTLHCAAATENSTIAFNIARNDEGSSILPLPEESKYNCLHARSVDVPSMTLQAIMEQSGLPEIDLLKMDIEGAEVAVLERCPASVLAKIAQITVEFHCDPSFGLVNRGQVLAVMRRLAAIGFSQYTFTENFTDVLFVNHRALRTGLLQRAGLRIRMSRPRLLLHLWASLPATLRDRLRRRIGATRG
jgi:FkbM family methyltransferase